ncbi:10413_t:CDS:1 [Dentiscutata heterogama]|uniref:10413_t:CDS:1 n=1 Tax=Dentiscutata heterogama TaxID=1316150 RepID=A0ACA9PS03_9GLOM|nr:10413_t:CDS:1 [Dentiscutata heterogama]
MPKLYEFNSNDFSDEQESIYKNTITNVEIVKTNWKTYDLDVVIKKFVKNNNEYKNEFNIFSNLKFIHRNIITYYGYCSDNPLHLVFEYADQGNLKKYLFDKFHLLTWDEKLKFCKDITCGLIFLHSFNIIHKDIRSKNILISQGTAKLCDFGFSKFENEKTRQFDVDGLRAVSHIDPQYIINPKYKLSKKSDIYSLGVVFWEISTGKIPYKNFTQESITIHVYSGKREIPGEDTPEWYKDIYVRCWDQLPENRPDIQEVFDIINNY